MTEYGNGGGYTVTMDGPFGGGGGGSSSEKMISIHAPVSDWKGATSPYSQVVEVYGLNIGSKVDIQISTQLLEQLSQQRIWFTAENRGGVVTLFAVGDKPAIDCEFQATLSDVVNITGEDIEAIRGNTVSTVIPQGDFAQKDPNKSDFIKNKPAPFVVSNEKPEGAAIWFNKKENLDDTTGDAHIMAHDLNMGQHKLYGLPAPTANDEAANKGYVNAQAKKAAPRNLLDNSDFRNPVDQRDGHYVPAGTMRYSDTALTTEIGVTSGNMIVISVSGSYGTTYRSDGVTKCYVKAEDVKRGYITNNQYTVDRWLLQVSNGATLTDEGITVAGGFFTQLLERKKLKANAKYTIGFMFNTGLAFGVVDMSQIATDTEETVAYFDAGQVIVNAGTDGIFRVYIGLYSTATVLYAFMYEGEYTLDTLPEYQPKGYGAEMAECKRYYRKFARDGYGTYLAGGLCVSETNINFAIHLDKPMRVAPTVTFNGSFAINSNAFKGTSLNAQSALPDYVEISATASDLVVGYSAVLQSAGGNSSIELSADL